MKKKNKERIVQQYDIHVRYNRTLTKRWAYLMTQELIRYQHFYILIKCLFVLFLPKKCWGQGQIIESIQE